jgi:hypothetical protein
MGEAAGSDDAPWLDSTDSLLLQLLLAGVYSR